MIPAVEQFRSFLKEIALNDGAYIGRDITCQQEMAQCWAPYHIDFFLSSYIQQHITLVNSVWAMIRSQYSGNDENFEILNHNGVYFTLHLQMEL